MNPELKQLLKDSRNAWKGMKANPDDSAQTRWDNKEEKKVKLLTSMENTDRLTYDGPGKMRVSDEQSVYGTTSVKIEAPSVYGEVPSHHRNYSRARIFFDAQGEDWREYNRISFWVYPDCEGYQNVWIAISLLNDGEVKYPRPQYFEGSHHINVPNKRWSQVVWEIPQTYRDKVSQIVLTHNLHGYQCDMGKTSVLYFNKMELSVVEEDHYEGWNIDDRIAFCHSGYRPEDKKVATTQNSGEKEFCLLDDNGNVAFKAPVKVVKTDIGEFEQMDFSDFKQEGKYCIKIGDRITKPFYIDRYNWESAVWKTINFFTQERCGIEIPGVHLPCHLDCFCAHPDGRKISVAGGWHDAGDVSQGVCNTAESAHAFLDMAERVKDTHSELYERLLDEARWGLNWMMRTRFGDGYRCTWITLGLWTENIIGDRDDVTQPAFNSAFDNLCAAAAEAAGARLFRGVDDIFADYCLKCAKEDFKFGVEGMDIPKPPTFALSGSATGQINAQAGVAAMEIYRACGDKFYLDEAKIFAKTVLACQQQDYPDWGVKIRGFFYETPEKVRPLAYEHRAHEQAFVMLLSMLTKADPNPKWKKGLELYAEYIKTISEYIKPYGLLPSAIYELNNGNYKNTPREKSAAAFDLAESDYNDQVLQGIKLSDTHYLRRFPVAFMFRGFGGVLMTKAKAAASAANALDDKELLEIARKQLEWIIGNNPFARSYMYGEGYDFAPMYSEFANDIVGEMPCGIQTLEHYDAPFMPMMNSATYNEIWVHASSRFLWTIADIF